MQNLGQTSTLGTVYTDSDVTTILLKQQNQERWFFDQLASDLSVKNDLSPYVDYEKSNPKISHDSTAVVQRTLELTLRGDAPMKEINFLSDIIRVRYQLKAPDGGWLEWSLGYFTLTPFDQDIYPGWSWHKVKSPDLGQLLVDATFTSSYGLAIGQNYITAITSIVNGYGGSTPIGVNIIPTTSVLPAVLAWETGVPRLQAINDLLKAINYFPAWFDETGTLRSAPIPDYNLVSASFVFDTTTGSSITKIPITERPDISRVYNQILVIGEDPRRTAFSYLYVNNDPTNPISTVNWHPKTLTIRDSKIADVATAKLRGQSEAQAASRIFGKQTISTFPWAISQNRDVYQLIYSTSDEGLQSNLYVEMKWDHVCRSGKPSSHSLEKIFKA